MLDAAQWGLPVRDYTDADEILADAKARRSKFFPTREELQAKRRAALADRAAATAVQVAAAPTPSRMPLLVDPHKNPVLLLRRIIRRYRADDCAEVPAAD